MTQITIAPTTNSSSARVEYFDGNGSDTAIPDADTTKDGHQVPLGVGENMITVQVTAADNTMLPYTVTVTRPLPMADATLSLLELSSNGSPITLTPTFASSIRDYTASVPNSVAQITIVATPTNSGATVVSPSPMSLRVGANTIDGAGHGRGRDHDADLHRDGDP